MLHSSRLVGSGPGAATGIGQKRGNGNKISDNDNAKAFGSRTVLEPLPDHSKVNG